MKDSKSRIPKKEKNVNNKPPKKKAKKPVSVVTLLDEDDEKEENAIVDKFFEDSDSDETEIKEKDPNQELAETLATLGVSKENWQLPAVVKQVEIKNNENLNCYTTTAQLLNNKKSQQAKELLP